MIVHITGAPGSGKSIIGKWIQDNYDIVVFDIDNLYHDFIAKKEKSNETIGQFKKNIGVELQNYIDKIIKKYDDIIFVGLNYPDPRIQFRGREIFVEPFKVNLNADYNIYIDIRISQIVKQKFKRTLVETIDNIDNVFEEISKQKERYLK